ncbi:MAG: hypothetical protein WCW44_04965 [archaeon]|jgi:hypothetical protein
MKKKIIEWIKRYAPAEVFAIAGALLGASISLFLTNNPIVSAYGATLGETILYYGFILARDMYISNKEHKKSNLKYTLVSFLKNIRNLLIEFTPAEVLDTLLIRPFCMYLFPLLLGNFYLGILAGKIAADVVFYIPVIMGYEFRKKYLK